MPTYAATLLITRTPATATTGIGGTTFSFATAQADPPGHIPDYQEEVQESLEDLGISGRRWRRVNKQYAPFMLTTIADATSYDAAKTLANQYRQARGQFGLLTITLDGTSYQFSNTKILDVKPDLRKGILTGAGAQSGSAAVLFCQWSMVLA